MEQTLESSGWLLNVEFHLAPVFCLADFGIRIKLGLAELDFFYSSFSIKTVIAISFVCVTIKTFKPGGTVL